jgi:hypothetical protein
VVGSVTGIGTCSPGEKPGAARASHVAGAPGQRTRAVYQGGRAATRPAASPLLTALAALADNVTALAGTVAEANAALRGRLGLDGADQDVIDHQPAENGTGRRKRQTA